MILVFIDIIIGIPDQIIYYVCIMISMFVGMLKICFSIGESSNESYYVTMAGKEINLKECEKLSFKEKIKVYNIFGIVMRVFAIFYFVFALFLIFEDPLEIFDNFKNKLLIQLFSSGLVIITTILIITGKNG